MTDGGRLLYSSCGLQPVAVNARAGRAVGGDAALDNVDKEETVKMITIALLALLLPVTDAAAVEKWGPTWSEVTGTRYLRATMNRAPAIIKSVDGRNYTDRIVKIEPGKRMVVVQSPARKGFQGSNKNMTMEIAPCKRYYINAQFDSSVGPEWKPVVAYVESIPGCRITKAQAA
jgi:hypothetical protein